jgi:hypothetical protein
MTRSSRNCWEFMQCGREPGGAEAGRIGFWGPQRRKDLLGGGRHLLRW